MDLVPLLRVACLLFLICLTSCDSNSVDPTPEVSSENLRSIRLIDIARLPSERSKGILSEMNFEFYRIIKIPDLKVSVLIAKEGSSSVQHVAIYSDFEIFNSNRIKSASDVYSGYFGGGVNSEYLDLYFSVRERIGGNLSPDAKVLISGYGAGGGLSMLLGLGLVHEGFNPSQVEVTTFGTSPFADFLTIHQLESVDLHVRSVVHELDKVPFTTLSCCVKLKVHYVLTEQGGLYTAQSQSDIGSVENLPTPSEESDTGMYDSHSFDVYLNAINNIKF